MTCVTKMRARDWPRTMPHDKARAAARGSQTCRSTRPHRVSMKRSKPRRYSLGCQVRRAGSRRVRSTYSWTVLPSVRHGQRRGTCGARGGRCGCTAGMSAICRRTSLGRSQSLSLGRCCLVVCARQRHGFLEQALKLHHVSKVSCECMSKLLMQVSMDLYAASMR